MAGPAGMHPDTAVTLTPFRTAPELRPASTCMFVPTLAGHGLGPDSCWSRQRSGARPWGGSQRREQASARRPAAEDLERDFLPRDLVWLVATPIMVPIVPERPPPWGVAAERRAAVPTGSADPPLVITPGPIEVSRSGLPRLVPAPSRRMMVECSEPGLRSQMPPGMIAVVHHLRRIVHDDFHAER